MPDLAVLDTRRRLRVARGGRLVPWLGPAVRGLAGGRFRARVCRLPVADQIGTFLRCAGCPVMAGCPYGETYEPDPPAGVRVAAGWENAARPLVVSPAFPAPPAAHVGDEIPVRVLFLGPAAIGHAAAFWAALAVGGADPLLELGEDRVLFDVIPDGPDRADEITLPADPAADPGVIPVVRIELASPLLLTANSPGGQKLPVLRPAFADLVRAGLRTLGPLFKCYGSPLPEEVFGRVKELAGPVPTLRSHFAAFRQAKASHRTGDRFDVVGAVGWAEYGPVPAGLLQWLAAAGRVHVGTHRVAGAGGWTVTPPGG